MPPTFPALFGRYVLLERLASGGMAEVYLALERDGAGRPREVVIKRILPSLSADPSFVRMLLHEGRVAATLVHPNLARVLEVDRAGGQYFLAMEHVHGADLRAVVRQMKEARRLSFPLEHALAIVLGLAAGLAHAHEARDANGAPLGLVHRDVSPQNVLVSFDGVVKLVDFGIAKSTAREQQLTQAGHLKGKAPYMSPEQARGEPLDARSDVFSAGILLFELTTGRRLFRGRSDVETLELIGARTYPRPGEVVHGYPPGLEAIVARALARDPAERYPSARALHDELARFVAAAGIVASPEGLRAFLRGLFGARLAEEERRRGPVRARALELLATEGAGRTIVPVMLGGSSATIAERSGLSVAAAGILVVVAAAAGASAAAVVGGPPVVDGHLEIAATGGRCAVTVDGRARGDTPSGPLAVAPGRHVVACRTSDGRTVEAEVQVPNGGLARHVFAF